MVSGAKAQYKEVGAVSGAGDYGFLLTATDGRLIGGGGMDKFRIKIWDKLTDTVVYDNVPGAEDDLDATGPQAIGAGSIVFRRAIAGLNDAEAELLDHPQLQRLSVQICLGGGEVGLGPNEPFSRIRTRLSNRQPYLELACLILSKWGTSWPREIVGSVACSCGSGLGACSYRNGHLVWTSKS